MDRIKHLWAHHRALLIAFIAVIGVIGFFTVRTVAATVYWMDPAHQDQALAPWMSPRYVAKSYKLPPEALGPALFLEDGAAPRLISLEKIAAENNMDMHALQLRIDAAAEAWRTDHDDTNP